MSGISSYFALALSLALCAARAAFASNIVGNGGFEVAGAGGAADSAQWTEFTSYAANVSARGTTNPAAGSYAHYLYAEGTAALGTVAGIQQNSGNDVGLPSLEAGTTLNASFDAMTPFGPGGVMNYTLRILNRTGAIVAIYNNTIPPPASSYPTFTTPDLTVPAFGAQTNDYYVAFFEINVASGGFVGSTATAYIDNVQINGTLTPEPASALLLAIAALALRRRQFGRLGPKVRNSSRGRPPAG